MRKITVLFILAGLVLAGSAFTIVCKKDKPGKSDTTLMKKYARYKVQVYRDKDFTQWGTTLEKAESVDLLSEEKYTGTKNRQYDLSHIKLADDKKYYLESRHLADKPVVFTGEDVKVYVRPNISSKVYATVPKGTIGFIVEEKADWVMVYIGNIGGKWITQQWAKDGFSADEGLVQEAKEYEAVTAMMDAPEINDTAMKAIKEKLSTLMKGTSVIAELARKKYDSLEGKPAGEGEPKTTEKPKEETPVPR